MVDRHQARILAMQSLCQLEVLADDFMRQLDGFLTDESSDAAVRDYARRLVCDTWANVESLDRRIRDIAEHWDIERMAAVDRNVIRVAVCEFLHRPDVPPHVVINEAVEIGKAFGTRESSAFINGILDAILRRLPERQAQIPLEPSSPAEG